jgi:methyl-accepting chemotaxis protein
MRNETADGKGVNDLRNLRIVSKLMLGFGIVLLVFGVAVCVTWMNMKGLQNESVFLRDRVVPAMMIASEAERTAADLFMTARETMYTGTKETMEDDDKATTLVEKSLADMEALGVKYPTMQSPKMMRETVVPVYKAYSDNLQKLHKAVEKKMAGSAAVTKAGAEVTASLKEALESFYSSTKSDILTEEKSRERITQIYLVGKLLDDVGEMRRRILLAVDVTRDSKAARPAMELTKAIREKSQAVYDSTQDPGRRKLMEHVLQTVENYEADLRTLMEVFDEMNALNETRVPMLVAYEKAATQVATFAQNTVKTVSESSLDSLKTTTFILLGSAALSIVLGVLIAYFISRSISRPLGVIVDLTKKCQEGDLTVTRQDFGYEGKDELGSLVSALSEMIAAQESALLNVVSVADAVSKGADNLSSIAEETNASMEQVKASIEQVSSLSESNGAVLQESNAGVEEMSAGADTVATSSTDSAAFIAQTTEASGKAFQTVNAMIDGMKNADKNSKESEGKTRQLVSSVEHVSSFVSVITGIADQTNLLALNAAIEAARAGEVGRGFAVVAEEVRKLAEESAKAAQNVKGIIADLQKEAQESITATTAAGRALSETLVQAVEAQKQLNGAMEEINKANDSIQNIAAVAQEQAASSREVATAIDKATQSTVEMAATVLQIQRAAEDTAQAAQGVAEQSEAMSNHARSLTEALSRFRLRNVEAEPKKAALKALKSRSLSKQTAR